MIYADIYSSSISKTWAKQAYSVKLHATLAFAVMIIVFFVLFLLTLNWSINVYHDFLICLCNRCNDICSMYVMFSQICHRAESTSRPGPMKFFTIQI